jgi:uncharacterized protein (DUF1697 family)
VPRHVAFLRGVSPMNAKMPELKRCFEEAGFTQVRTVLSSGNIVFDTNARSETALARKIEAAMEARLGRTFYTLLRSVNMLHELIEADPYAGFRLPADAKRVVTFLREPPAVKLKLPIETNGVRILAMHEREVFTAYVPQPGNPVFMTMLEKTFGTGMTTRTWDSVRKCVRA